jgi:hypothetical protein
VTVGPRPQVNGGQCRRGLNRRGVEGAGGRTSEGEMAVVQEEEADGRDPYVKPGVTLCDAQGFTLDIYIMLVKALLNAGLQ